MGHLILLTYSRCVSISTYIPVDDASRAADIRDYLHWLETVAVPQDVERDRADFVKLLHDHKDLAEKSFDGLYRQNRIGIFVMLFSGLD
jgi:hypothetical protein